MMLVYARMDTLMRSNSGRFKTVLAGFLWCETFVGFGLHCFWLFSKSTPLAVDNAWGVLYLLLPFLCMFFVGVLAKIAGIRRAFAQVEAPLHWMACLVQFLLLFYVVVKDPFSGLFPLGTPMVLWSAGWSMALAANMVTHLREQAVARSTPMAVPGPAAAAMIVLCWGAMVWLGSGMAWVVYFWTASIVLHAIWASMAPRQQPQEGMCGMRGMVRGEQVSTQAEALFWLAFLLLFQVRAISIGAPAGTFETKPALYVGLFCGPQFLAGAALFLLAARGGLSPLVHFVVAAGLAMAPSVTGGMLAFGAGYAFPALYRVTRRQGPLGYALSCALISSIWMVGLAGFTFCGLIADYKAAQASVHILQLGSSILMAVLFVLWVWAGRIRREPREPNENSAIRSIAPAWVFCLLLIMAVAPGIAVLVSTAWPPFRMQRSLHQPVDTPMGLCHAGLGHDEERGKLLNDLGVQSIRMGFAWGRIQPAPGVWKDEPFDLELIRAIQRGIIVAGVFDYDNDNVEQNPDGRTRDKYIAPSDIPLFLDYVRHVVERHKDTIRAWEIWNEPNISRFWTGTMDEFCVLARRTAELIREIDPSSSIIGTPMTGPLGVVTPSGIEALHASGALKQVDHPNGHLYLTDPRHYYYEFYKLIGAARRFNHPGSLCITEMGSPDGGAYPWRSEGDLLASHAIKAYTIGTSLGVTMMNWYCLKDDSFEDQSAHPLNSEHFFGLVRPDNSWKPSAYAYRLFSRHCTQCEIRNDLLNVSGGLAARQLRATLYRRENGESTLVMWFEPMLRPWGRAHVKLDLGAIRGPATLHDIASDYSKAWLDSSIEISETPAVLSFTANDTQGTVTLTVSSSPVDAFWLLALIVLIIGSMVLRRRTTG